MSGTTDSAAGGAVNTPDPAIVDPATATANAADQNAPDEKKGDDGQPPAGKGDVDAEPKQRKHSKLETIKNLRDERRSNRAEIERLRAENERLKKPLVKDRSQLDYDQTERLRVREGVREERIEENTDRIRDLAERERSTAEAEFDAVVDGVVETLGSDERFPGLADKIEKINLHAQTVHFMADSERAAEFANHLVLNPKVADQLYRMCDRRSAHYDPQGAERFMARIEAGIIRAPARKATAAPNPGTTLNGAGAPTTAQLAELAKSEDASAYIRQREAAWKKGNR